VSADKRKHWTAEDMDILIARYPVEDDLALLAEDLGRPLRGVISKAEVLKLYRVPPRFRMQWRADRRLLQANRESVNANRP